MNALEITLVVLIIIALTTHALTIRELRKIEKAIQKALEEIMEKIIS
jgi:hypothetical protein